MLRRDLGWVLRTGGRVRGTTKNNFYVRYPSPGASRHPLPLVEGARRHFLAVNDPENSAVTLGNIGLSDTAQGVSREVLTGDSPHVALQGDLKRLLRRNVLLTVNWDPYSLRNAARRCRIRNKSVGRNVRGRGLGHRSHHSNCNDKSEKHDRCASHDDATSSWNII